MARADGFLSEKELEQQNKEELEQQEKDLQKENEELQEEEERDFRAGFNG